MPRDRVSRLALGLLLLVVGCSDSGREPFPDGGDPGADRAADGDSGGDPGTDRAADAGDAGPDPCPGPEAYIGDDWAGVLEIGPDQCFLAASIEGLPRVGCWSGLLAPSTGSPSIRPTTGSW